MIVLGSRRIVLIMLKQLTDLINRVGFILDERERGPVRGELHQGHIHLQLLLTL